MITAPLAFIYDRCATANTTALELRLQVCQEYVTKHGCEFGGWWVDTGDQALTVHQRPAFDRLLDTMRSTPFGTPRVCLIHDRDRISRDAYASNIFTRRVLLSDGWVETCLGERRTSDGWQRQVGRRKPDPRLA
jgi:DNA invertase Pin-like site-specific DNA recombinase